MNRICSTSANNDQEPSTLFYAFVCLPEKGRAWRNEACAFLSQAESRAPASFRMIGQRVALPEGRGGGGEEWAGEGSAGRKSEGWVGTRERGAQEERGGGGGDQGGERKKEGGGGEQVGRLAEKTGREKYCRLSLFFLLLEENESNRDKRNLKRGHRKGEKQENIEEQRENGTKWEVREKGGGKGVEKIVCELWYY